LIPFNERASSFFPFPSGGAYLPLRGVGRESLPPNPLPAGKTVLSFPLVKPHGLLLAPGQGRFLPRILIEVSAFLLFIYISFPPSCVEYF